ncbi:hypothetical protein A9Q83_15440 [Alphaproteobacteria bacterium 46_93_T64]|nr:hypothetical protein A9Q83_15440 [Alphaproteobacteria bacterium 46_93_T64]
MKKVIGISALLLPFVLGACGATTQSATTPEIKLIAVKTPILSKEKKISLAALSKKPEILPKARLKQTEPVIPLPPIGVLRGKSIAEIEAVFGKPVLLRKDKPAQVWQYLTSECALHLVFYPEDEGNGTMRVKYFSMNDRDVARPADSKPCFKSQLHRVGVARAKSLS